MEATVTNFAHEARQYCDLMERSQVAKSSWAFANECLQSLLRLYSAVLALPEKESGNQQRADDQIWRTEWKAIRTSVAERLSRDLYWEIFEPLEVQPPEPLAGSISDDLADIWLDVQVGLRRFDVDANAAIWHWRFSMETHWGHHAVGAAAALTALCFGPHADETRP